MTGISLHFAFREGDAVDVADILSLLFLHYLVTKGETDPHRYCQLLLEKYISSEDLLMSKFGLGVSDIVDIFKFLLSRIHQSVNGYFRGFSDVFDEPMKIWEKWRSGGISTEEMKNLAEKANLRVGPALEKQSEKVRAVLTIEKSELEQTFGSAVVSRF